MLHSMLKFPIRPWSLLLLLPAVLLLALPLMRWLDQQYVAGAGAIWITLTTLLGGVAIRLRQATAISCAGGPRLRPLQVSCLAALALGVQLMHATDTPGFALAFPLLAWPWLPAVSILGGIAGLALLSLFSDCRDAELLGRV